MELIGNKTNNWHEIVLNTNCNIPELNSVKHGICNMNNLVLSLLFAVFAEVVLRRKMIDDESFKLQTLVDSIMMCMSRKLKLLTTQLVYTTTQF